MPRIGTTTLKSRFEIEPTSNQIAKRTLTVILITIAGAGLFALFGRTPVVKSRSLNTVEAASRANSYFHFQNGREMQVAYRGEEKVTTILNSGAAQPRAMGTADFDRNGTPDLVAGYSYEGGGVVTVQRGNPDAFAPADDSVFARLNQGYDPDSLLPGADVYEVPAAVDYLQVGDFNHDNERDVLVAANGGGMFLLAGDGNGGLRAAESISLPGTITCMAAGEFRAPDGWTDVAVGVNGPSGPELLIFDGVSGIGSDAMQWSLSAPATAVEFGEMDSTPFHGVAVATGSQVNVIHGWGRKQTPTLASRVETIATDGNVRGLASGFFVWTREANAQIATLTEDGTIRILERGQANTQPFSDEEIQQRARLRLFQNKSHVDIETVPAWESSGAPQWTSIREIPTGDVVGAGDQNPLQRGHISFMSTDDLMVVGATQQRLDIFRQVDSKAGKQSQVQMLAGDMVATRLDTVAPTAAVLPLPQKLNGYRSLLMLQANSSAPTVVPLAPTATIVVDRTDDPSGAALTAASVCGVGASDCSLRGAVQFANANSGTVITFPAGAQTYVLTISGANGCVNESPATGNTIGDLEVNASTTITGNGAASTIIRQGAATNDRVLCMDVPLTVGLTYTFSGMTITGGRDANSNNGGGGFLGGAKNVITNLTNVTFANNQTTGPSFGGGGAMITGGDMNVTTCTFGAANNPSLGATRNDLTLGNLSNTTSGGGFGYSPHDPAGSGGATGTLTVVGTTFTHNFAVSAGAGGAGLDTFAINLSSGTANISTTTFSNNQATGTSSGGGIYNESLTTVNIATTAFNTNAGNRGGGLYVGGGTVVLNGTSPSITFSGNTATVAGSSSIFTGAILNVTGTNTTIGGDIEVATNGIWTNTAGSAVAPTNVLVDGGVFTCNNSTIDIAGNLTIQPGAVVGATWNANTSAVTIAGNFAYTAGGAGPATTFNAGTGSFTFDGNTAQSISNTASITFNNLTDSNVTQPLTFNNSLAVNGTLNINGANAILAPVAAAVISGSGTLNGTGTARVTRTAATPDFSSQYTMTTKTISSMTVEYIGAGAQTVSALTYNILKLNNASGATLATGTTTVNGTLILTAGALNVSSNTLIINDGTSVGTGTLTSGPTGTVNYNQGSNGQNVLAGTYGNLTFSNFNKTLASTGTIGIAGTFTPGSATGHTITGSTIDFNGVNPQTIPAFNYNNLTSSNTGGRTLANAGTIGVFGTFTPGGNVYTITGSTIDFNGTGAQSVAPFNYNNLTISGNRGGAAITLGAGTIGVAGAFSPTATNNTYVTTGNTVNYNGSAAQTITAFTYGGLTLSNAAGANLGGDVTVNGALALNAGAFGVGTNTLTLNGAASFGAGTLTSAATGTVNYNQQSNGQATVLAANYGNLTFSNFNKTLASSGTIGIAGTFTPGSATGHTITGSTINFNAAGTQTIPGFTYNNLTSSGGAAARTLDPVNTIKIAGVFTPGTNVYTITGSTIEYNGTSAQSLPSTFTTYNNLTLNNTAGTTGFAGLTVQGTIEVKAGTFTSSSTYNNVLIDSGATLATTAGSTINVAGNWTQNGTFTSGTSTVVFNGNDNTQTLSGTSSFNNLTGNHTGTGGVTASGSTLTVTGLFKIQAGTFTTSGTFNNVQIESGGTLASDGGTMNVSGNWTNNGGTFTPSTGTVNFTGGVAQAINGTAAAQTFNNFIVNKSAGALSTSGSTTSLTTNNFTLTAGTFTAPATMDINGNVVLTAGTYTAGATTTVAGNWTNNGATFTAGTGTVTFDGAAAQTIGGTTATTFNNLTSGGAAGISMTNDNTVNGALALTSSDITVAATKTLTQPAAGTSSGTFDVNGRVQRNGFVSGGAALSFGNPFNTIQVTAPTAPANIVVDLARTAPASFPSAVKRTYTITPSAGGFTGTLRLHYLDSELPPNSEPGLIFRRFNGTGWSPVAPTSADTTNNWLEKTGVTQFSPWTFDSTNVPTATTGTITGRITSADGAPVVGAVVNLNGSAARKTITDATGTYKFTEVETSGFYTVTPARANYSFTPANRAFAQIGDTTEAAFTGTMSADSVNPLDTPEYFVRQQYVDVLNREPDEAGFNYWSNQLLACGSDTGCLRSTRTSVAAAFFIEQEFRQSGAFIYNAYAAGLGRRAGYSEYAADRTSVVGGPTLDVQKQQFARAFVNRSEFAEKYESNNTAESFVDALLSNATNASSLRDNLIARYNQGANQNDSRAIVVLDLVDSAPVRDANYNSAFVLVEYFGYLHRDPDQGGYDFWRNVLNNSDANNYRGMVCSFITSTEYQQRFSNVVSHNNGECGQ